MEVQYLTQIKDLADGIDLTGKGDDNDYTITDLKIDWRLVINTSGAGIEGMYPIIGTIKFEYEEYIDGMRDPAQKVVLTTSGKSEDSGDIYEDAHGESWLVTEDHSEAGIQYFIDNIAINLKDRTVDIEFSKINQS